MEKVDAENKNLHLKSGNKIRYDVLVIGCGSKSNKFGWPGQDMEGVQGLYSYQDLELMETNTMGIENAVIVGGGLIGAEMAETKFDKLRDARQNLWVDRRNAVKGSQVKA